MLAAAKGNARKQKFLKHFKERKIGGICSSKYVIVLSNGFFIRLCFNFKTLAIYVFIV